MPWLMPITLPFGELRQEDGELEASLRWVTYLVAGQPRLHGQTLSQGGKMKIGNRLIKEDY